MSIVDVLTREAITLSKNPEFCLDRVVDDVMICVKFSDGHIHTVFPKDEDTAKDLSMNVVHSLGIVVDSSFCGNVCKTDEDSDVGLPKKIVFHNRQAIGDILMFTCAVRDFKNQFPNIEVKVESTAMHIWDFNPYICNDKWEDILDPLKFNETPDVKPSGSKMIELNKKAIKEAIKSNKPVRIYIGPGKGTNASNRSDRHFANAYRMSIEDSIGVSIAQGPIRPDIYMSEEEYNREPIIKPPYWIIVAGEKGDWTCKTFAFIKWQEVVKKLPNLKFIQIGSSGHKHPSLDGDNVINFIGKTEDRHTGIRDLFNLFLNAEGSMGLVSFQMHLAAAFNKPCIVIAGAREPVWFTRYPGQNYLASDGCLPCTITKKDEPTSCWFCEINRCPFKDNYENQVIPKCANLYTSDDVVNEIKRYYDGGRLSYDKPLGKSKLIGIASNVNKPEEKHLDPVVSNDLNKDVCRTALCASENETRIATSFMGGFGGGAITDRDWAFIKEVIDKYDISSIIEFGSGLSTILLNSLPNTKVVSFETSVGWIKKVKEGCEKDVSPDIHLWDGKSEPPGVEDRFDMCFLDGPAGGENRAPSFKIAAKYSDVIIVHDAGRVPERKWQEMYLSKDFDFISNGGHRCKLWKRKNYSGVQGVPKKIDNRKTIKVAFNGRGDGGAERSTTIIMNEFVKMGWRVDYFSPTGKKSAAFNRFGNNDVNFIGSDPVALADDCDIFLLYCNDWVWDFKLPNTAELLSRINANNKKMVINFRLGEIGTNKALWTLGWDNYIFLNSSLEKALLDRCSLKKSTILAPPIDLTDFYKNNIDLSGKVKLIRHSSQGDTKYQKDFNEVIDTVLNEFSDLEIHLMPAPSFIKDFGSRVITYKRNVPPISEFLCNGNVFWYKLPVGYHDQGPKVIMEAQASGLPIIAENHSGAVDRVISGSGILCNTIEDHIDAIRELHDFSKREEFGRIGREHANKEYGYERWIDVIKEV